MFTLSVKPYQYIGPGERTYPDIAVPGKGCLVVEPGDVHEFEDPPGDGNWVPAPKSKPEKKADA